MDRHPREIYQSVKVAVWIPLLQAVVSGALIGSGSAALLYYYKISAVLILAGVVAATVASIVWISALAWWRSMAEGIDSKIERIPLTSYVEPELLPEPEPVSVRLELSSNGGREMHFIELPCSPSKLAALARGLLSGKSFTEAAWCGSGGIFSRAEFVQLREEMLKRGLIELNSPSTPARGYRLTRGGYAALKYIADGDTHPLLESGNGNGTHYA